VAVKAITKQGEQLDPEFPQVRTLDSPIVIGNTVGQAAYPWGDEWWIVMIALRTVLEEMTPLRYASLVADLGAVGPG
jgi:hypothetical protein